MIPNQSPEVESSVTTKEEKKKRGYVKYSPMSLVFLSLCAFVFCFSLLGLFEQSVLDLAGRGVIEEVEKNAFDPIPDNDPSVISPFSPNGRKWQQIASKHIDVSTLPYLQTVRFDFLKEQNKDTVAWLYWPTTTDVKGLPFNRAVVQSSNNDYYLSKSFDNSNNANGWIYMDYRCDMEDLLSNYNLIIYGHARSYLMFGGLRYLNGKTKWQQDGYNQFIYINTPREQTVWQIFSWYETTTEFNYITTHFTSDAEHLKFLNTLQSQNTISAFEHIEFTPDSRILTFSTCKGSNSNVRIAMHAVLVKHKDLFSGEELIVTYGADSITDDSNVVTDITDAPTDIVTDSSGSATGSLTDITTDIPTDATDIPTDSTDASTDVTDTPTDVTDTPTDATDVTDAPTDATDTPTDATDTPADSTDTTDSSTGSSDLPTDSSVDSSTDVNENSSAETSDGPLDPVNSQGEG